jgi:hypothetical protein
VLRSPFHDLGCGVGGALGRRLLGLPQLLTVRRVNCLRPRQSSVFANSSRMGAERERARRARDGPLDCVYRRGDRRSRGADRGATGARSDNASIDRGATREEGEPASGGSPKGTIQGCRRLASGRRISCRNRGSISDADRLKRRGRQILRSADDAVAGAAMLIAPHLVHPWPPQSIGRTKRCDHIPVLKRLVDFILPRKQHRACLISNLERPTSCCTYEHTRL